MIGPIGILLPRLDQVKETGADKWQARCPAHPDRNPSLSIARGDDGRVLLKCWAGCGAADVVQSVGLTLADLFVREETRHQTPTRNRQYPNYRNVLRLIRHEVEVILLASSDLAAGKQLSDSDTAALWRARSNIEKTMRAAGV